MDTQGLKFRKATSSDTEFAYQTKKAAFKQYVDEVWGWDEDEQRQMHEKRFKEQDFLVIQQSGVDVGILAMVQQPDCVHVYQLFIVPEYQSKGIGAACMTRVIGNANVANLPVRLQVLKVNKRALAFWEKLGFKSTGETDTHILMEKPL